MSDSGALHRAYRRLLAAYPRSYRRTREVEMLTTLMDAARPQQRRPTMREAVDLLGGGIRYRFRLPHGPAYVVVAALAALLGALVVSAGAALAVWNLAKTMPSREEAGRVAALVGVAPPAADPGAAAARVQVSRVFYDEPLQLDSVGEWTAPGDEGYTGPAPAPGGPTYPRTPSPRVGPGVNGPYAALDQASERLAAEGWAVDDPRTAGHGIRVFWAHRDGFVVRVTALALNPEPGSVHNPKLGLWVNVRTVAPAAVTPLAAAGAMLGLLLGWLLAAGVLRAFARHTMGGRAVMAVVGGMTLITGTVCLVVPALAQAAGLLTDGWSPHDSLVGAATLWSYGGVAGAVGAGLLILVLVAVAAPDRPAPLPVAASDLGR